MDAVVVVVRMERGGGMRPYTAGVTGETHHFIGTHCVC